MKKTFTILFMLAATGLFFIDTENNSVTANTSGSQGGYSGSLSDGRTCGTNGGCHGGGATNLSMITTDIPATGWVPNTTYSVTVTVSQAGINKFGFEWAAEDASGTDQGFALGSSDVQNITSGNGAGHVTHVSSSTSGTGTASWSFLWTAPAAGVGDITMYAAGNAANGQNNTTGDVIYQDAVTFSEDGGGGGVSIEENLSLLRFEAFPNPVQDQLNVNLDIASTSMAEMYLFDLQGRLIETLHYGNVSAGEQQMSFDLSNLEQGLYTLNLVLDGKMYSQRVMAY